MNKMHTSHRILRLLAVVGILLMVVPMPVSMARAQDAGFYDISFEQLGYDESSLQDPYGYARYYFSLPANWQPLAGSYVDLHLSYWVANGETGTTGNVTVLFNGQVMVSEDLDAQGEITLQVDLPPELMRLPEDNLVNALEIRFEAYVACDETNKGAQALLAIRKSSYFHFAYKLRPLTVDLGRYPQPFYNDNAFIEEQTTLVLPDQPVATDLEAAVTISALLGRLTGNRIELDVASAANWNPAADGVDNLIVVGKPDTNPIIAQLKLPASLQERSLGLWSVMPAQVTAQQPFTLTLNVKNTSDATVQVNVLDRLPDGATIKGCSAECIQSNPGEYEWQVGSLEAGQEVSNQVQVVLNAALFPTGSRFEHTASLYDADRKLINVDSLSVPVAEEGSDSQAVPPAEKGKYFFAVDERAVSENDGLIQEIISPWDAGKAIVVVTGLTDEALLKAGWAMGTRTQFPGMNGQMALIENTLPYTLTKNDAVDIPFQSLGLADTRINATQSLVTQSGSTQGAMQVKFDVPYAWALGEDTSLALHFAYSAALQKLTGTLEVGLNGMPVNSVLLGDQPNVTTWMRLSLPKNRIHVGSNVLTLGVTADIPRCASLQVINSLWATVFADSYLHLPHDVQPTAFDLRYFPQPFVATADLSDTVFALPEQVKPAQAMELLRLAEYLGYTTKGNTFRPKVVLGGDPTKEPLAGYNLIAYGRPTENAYIAAANASLAQPFIPGADSIIQTVDNVVYRLPDKYDLGFIQLLNSPWSQDKMMLVVTGSSNPGVSWAVNGLLDTKISYKLKGNLGVLISAEDVRSTDTRTSQAGQPFFPALAQFMTTVGTVVPTATSQPALTPSPAAVAQATQVAAATAPEPGSPGTAPQGSVRPVWLLPLMIASALVVVFIASLAVLRKS